MVSEAGEGVVGSWGEGLSRGLRSLTFVGLRNSLIYDFLQKHEEY